MDISPKALIEAIEQVAFEKKLPPERILETVEAALAAAYRKDFGHPEQIVRVKLNPESAAAEVSVVHEIVDEVENPHTQVTPAEAKERGMKAAKAGDELVEKVDPPDDYGRIAAQTAKQVIIQKIREVEREIVQEEFSGREGELMTGAVQRVEGRNVFVELGRALGVLLGEDQIEHERYYIGQRLRVMLRALDPEGRGAQLLLTRSNPDFVRRLFELEVPEIHAGTVEVMSIAREAGVRTKVAVHSHQDGVDPVGTCVGQRGTRVQAIMAELGDEKIDIVLYAEDVVTYIMNALSPAKISKIDLDDEHKTAKIHVADDQLSLAIGRGGQNVRLAGDLTGWQLDIEKSEAQKRHDVVRAGGAAEDAAAADGADGGIPLADVEGVGAKEAAAFAAAGLGTAQQTAAATPDELAVITGIEAERQEEIRELAAAAVSESGDASDAAVAERDADAAETEADTDIEAVPEPSDAELAAEEAALDPEELKAEDPEAPPGKASAKTEAATTAAASEETKKSKGTSKDTSADEPADEPANEAPKK